VKSPAVKKTLIFFWCAAGNEGRKGRKEKKKKPGLGKANRVKSGAATAIFLHAAEVWRLKARKSFNEKKKESAKLPSTGKAPNLSRGRKGATSVPKRSRFPEKARGGKHNPLEFALFNIRGPAIRPSQNNFEVGAGLGRRPRCRICPGRRFEKVKPPARGGRRSTEPRGLVDAGHRGPHWLGRGPNSLRRRVLVRI